MILGWKKYFKFNLKVGSINIKESEEAELARITIDKTLNLRQNIGNIWRTAEYILQAFIRIRKYLKYSKANENW